MVLDSVDYMRSYIIILLIRFDRFTCIIIISYRFIVFSIAFVKYKA